MQQILIPTDFSENAWNATAYAFQFFKNEPIAFHFLHIDVAMQANADANLYHAGIRVREEISDELMAEMDAWMQRVHQYEQNSMHQFTNTLLKSSFVEGIRQYIAKKKISFMVMGTKGATGLKEMTIGSRTGVVITRVKCPTLVIPEEAQFKIPVQIGFPTDFNMLYKNKIIETLLKITDTHKSAIKVLRVAQNEKPLNDFQNNNRELLKLQLQHTPHSFHVIENPSLENAIQAFVNSMQIDMVAMVAKNLNFFQRILFKPQVAQISYHLQTPFLVLHE